MVRILTMLLSSSLALALALAGQAAALPAISGVVVTQNGGRSDSVTGDETVADCARFRVTAAQARDYFRRARRATHSEYGHDLSMSRCFVSGTLRLAGGRKYRWYVDYERRGEIILPRNGRAYFYCGACSSPPFDEVYDPDKD